MTVHHTHWHGNLEVRGSTAWCKYHWVKMDLQGKMGCIWHSCTQESPPCCTGILTSPRSWLLWYLCTCGPPQLHPHSPCPCCSLWHGTPSDRYQGSVSKWWTHLQRDHLHASTTQLHLCHTPKTCLLSSQDTVQIEAEWLMLVPEAHWNPHWQTWVLSLQCWPGGLLQMSGRWSTYHDHGAHQQLHYCCNKPGTDWTSKTWYQKVCWDHRSGGTSLAVGHWDQAKQRGMHHFPLPTCLYQVNHPPIWVWGPETHLYPNGSQCKTLCHAVSLDQIPIHRDDAYSLPWGHWCPTANMVTNVFTKALPSPKVKQFTSELRLCNTWGGVLEEQALQSHLFVPSLLSHMSYRFNIATHCYIAFFDPLLSPCLPTIFLLYLLFSHNWDFVIMSVSI